MNRESLLLVLPANLPQMSLSMGLVRLLAQARPQVGIGAWVSGDFAALLEDHSMIEWIYSERTRAGTDLKESNLGFWSVLQRVRQQNFSRLVGVGERSRWLATSLAGVPRCAVTHAGPEDHADVAPRFGSLIAPFRRIVGQILGRPVTHEDFVPRLELSAEDHAWWERFSLQNGLRERGFVLMAPMASVVDESWPLTAWLELLLRLRQSNPEVPWLVAAPAGAAGLGPWLSRHPDLRRTIVVPDWPIRPVKVLAAKARVFAGHEDGAAYLAAGFGTPSLLLRHGDRPLFDPPQSHGVIRTMAYDPLRCLPVDRVWATFRHLLMESESAS